MGVLNKTCAISRFPISIEQKVRLFFIASTRGKYQQQSAEYSSLFNDDVYIYDSFKIIGGIGIKAELDIDKNIVFDETTIEAQYILSIIKEKYRKNKNIVNDDGSKPRYGGMFRDENLNIAVEDLNYQKILDMIDYGDLYINSLMVKDVADSVSIMLIHEDVYQDLINENTVIFEKISNDKFEDVNYSLRELFDKELMRFAKWKEEVNEYKNKILKNEEKKEKGLLNMAEYIIEYGEDYERHYSLSSKKDFFNLRKMLEDERFKNENEESVLYKVFETQRLVYKMDQYSIEIKPAVTSGDKCDYIIFSEYYKRLSLLAKKLEDDFYKE